MGTTFQLFTATLIVPLSIASIAWSTPAAALDHRLSIELANQTYQPPNNGGPSGTTGSGIR